MLKSLLCTVGLLAFASQAGAQSFNARPGAWENAVTTSGLTVPPEVLAKMPPERRAMVEQKLAESNGGQAQVRKVCIRKEDLDKGFAPNPNASCTAQTVSKTATKVVMTTSCKTPVASTGTMTWEARSPESVVGNIDQDVGGRKVHIGIVGRWVGDSCDGIAPLPKRDG